MAASRSRRRSGGGRARAAVAVGALIAALFAPFGAATSATAATLQPSGLATGMIVDGTVDPGTPPNTFNWGDFITGVQPDSSFTFTPTGPYTTTQGLASTGIIEGAFDWDNSSLAAACAAGAEPTGAPPSQSPNTNPWLPGTAKPNEKGDLCSTAYGLEVVTDAAGTRHTILYGYWTRYVGNGEVSIFQHLEGPGNGRCNDVLIEFDYESSGTTARVLRWAPTAGDACANPLGAGTWVAQPGTADFTWATGIRQEGPPLTNQPLDTFGEFAIDLNTSGIFAPTECRTFEVSEMFTRTGNSAQANIQDFADHAPDAMSLSNCGALTVTKATVPDDVEPTDDFGFTITREGGPVIPGPPPVDSIVDTLAAGETKTYEDVLVSSQYHLTETSIPPPWSLQSIVCTAIPLGGGPPQEFVIDDPSDAFLVSPENTTDCVITNAAAVVTVEKQTLPDGAAGAFGFEVTGQDDVTLGDGDRRSFAVPVGEDVTITEAAADGWLAPDIACDSGGAEVDGRSATVTPAAGENITCTFTNTQLGTVIVSKEAHGVDGRTFSFASDLPGGEAFDIEVPNGDGTLYEETFTGVPPGEYTLSEDSDAADPPTRLADLSCTYGGTDHTGDTAARSIDFTVLPGETVRCFFTNSLAGSIAVIKRTVPVEYDQLFDFVFTPPDAAPTGFQLNGDSTPPNVALRSFGSLEPGSYTVTEPADVDGWTLEGLDCNGAEWQPSADGRGVVVDLADTDAAVCFFTNRADTASLTLTKTVAGADADLAWSFAFDLVGPDGTTIGRTATEAAPTVQWDELVPGATYTLRESGAAQAGWSRGAPVCGLEDLDPATAGLQFSPTPGQAVECTVENAAEASSISVAKVAAGIGDDFAWSFDLGIDPVPTGESSPKVVSGVGQSGEIVTWGALMPGRSYSITESGASGWSSDVACTGLADEDLEAPGLQFTAPVGLDLECTMTNRATAGTGALTKTSLGGDGEFEFVLTDLDHAIDPITVGVTTAGGGAEVELPQIIPGVRYSFVEVDRPDWIEGALTCTITPGDGGPPFVLDDLSDFSVNPGDVGACSAVNSAYGRIVVVKAVDGADGEFGFTGDWRSPSEFTITTSDGTGAAAFDGVVPGSYTVEELSRDGYETTGLACVDGAADGTPSTTADLVGSIGLDPGETVTCTFTNTEWGVIVVDKSTTPPGSSQEFGFEWGPDGGDEAGFALSDASEPFTTAPLAPGDYRVTELETAGWALDGVTCTGGASEPTIDGANAVIALGLGETVVCTFANSQVLPPEPPEPPEPPAPPAPEPPHAGALPASGFEALQPMLAAIALLLAGAGAYALGRSRDRRAASGPR
ncbi:prealbumin-like fold domain-containing protein [Agromyces sp. NPDC055658]